MLSEGRGGEEKKRRRGRVRETDSNIKSKQVVELVEEHVDGTKGYSVQ